MLPLPPAAPCRATMNLSGRAFVTESRCRLGSAAPLSPALLQPLAARCCWSRFSELPVVRGSSPAFPRVLLLSFLPPSLFSCSATPAYCTLPDFCPSCRVLPFFAIFCLARCADDFTTELSQCSLSSGTPAQCTVHSLPGPQQELMPSHFHF